MFTNYPKLKPILITIASVVAAALLIGGITVLIISNLNPYGPALTVQNITELAPELSKDQIHNIEHQLHEIVLKNSDLKDTDGLHAAIREGTIRSRTATTFAYLGFIIDVAELQQSYSAQVEWQTAGTSEAITGYPVIVTCVYDKDAIIYPDFACQDDFAEESTPADTASFEVLDLLPHTIQLPDSDAFYITSGYYKNDHPTLDISFNGCNSDVQLKTQSVITATKEWLQSVSIDPEQFNYHTTAEYKNCIIK